MPDRETNIGYHSRLPQDLSGGGSEGSGAGIKTFGLTYVDDVCYLTKEPGSDVKITLEDIPTEPFIAYFHYVNGAYIYDEVAYPLIYEVLTVEGDIQPRLYMLSFNRNDINYRTFVPDENGYFRYATV